MSILLYSSANRSGTYTSFRFLQPSNALSSPEGNYEGIKVELSADGSSYTKTITARKNSIGIEANTLYEWSFTPQGTYLLVDSPTVSSML